MDNEKKIVKWPLHNPSSATIQESQKAHSHTKSSFITEQRLPVAQETLGFPRCMHAANNAQNVLFVLDDAVWINKYGLNNVNELKGGEDLFFDIYHSIYHNYWSKYVTLEHYFIP